MVVSVICVYNSDVQYEDELCSSLNTQDIEFDLVGVRNIHNEFKSAASALNYGVSKAIGDVLVFSHQDIVLKTNTELREIAYAISNSEIGTVIGTQGVKESSHIYYTNLTSGEIYNPEIVYRYNRELYDVSCVDEGFFGMRRETWEKHPFNEILCDDWHLYCVEECLWNRKNGGKVLVYPTQLHHFSKGTISKAYMDNLKLLCRVYRRDFKHIWTTCYKVRTNPLYINTLVFAWKANRLIKDIPKQW